MQNLNDAPVDPMREPVKVGSVIDDLFATWSTPAGGAR